MSDFFQTNYTMSYDPLNRLTGAGGIGGLLARTDNTRLVVADPFASAYYHCDGNGNVTCLLTAYQQLAAKYFYDPYGNLLAMYGSLAGANTYRFSSKEWDGNAGLYYYGYRFYDPNLQRWVNRDPLGDFGSTVYDQVHIRHLYQLSIDEQREANAFKFVYDNPISVNDLLGLQSWMGPGYGAFGPGGVNGGGGGAGCCPNGQSHVPGYQYFGFNNMSSCMSWCMSISTGWGAIPGGIGIGLGLRGVATWPAAGYVIGAAAGCAIDCSLVRCQ